MIDNCARCFYLLHYLYMDEYTISWVAPEYEHREHDSDWYWAVGIISVSLAVAFVIIGNILLSIILLVGMGTILSHSRHYPKNVEYELSKKGVRAGKTLYPWETLDSFWIIEGHTKGVHEFSPKLLVTSKKTFMPHIVIPLSEFVLEEVHHLMSQMIHEVPQMEPPLDRLIRAIGF